MNELIFERTMIITFLSLAFIIFITANLIALQYYKEFLKKKSLPNSEDEKE